MKVVITGSLGHIGKPLTQELVQRGHAVTVVSSKSERKDQIEALGAQAAIGTMEDQGFLTATFRGADAVFLLIAPGGAFADPNLDIDARFHRIGEVAVQALQAAGVMRLVYLSSIGADLPAGTGLLRLHHKMEAFLDQFPLALTVLRPAGFYTNLFGYIPMIQARGAIAAGFGDGKGPWVSPTDIATAAAEELEALRSVQAGAWKLRYVASEELTGPEVARILGQAIGQPELKWVTVPGEQLKQGMVASGMPPAIAEAMAEMQESQRTGKLSEHYFRNRPVLGQVKLSDFAQEFAAAFR